MGDAARDVERVGPHGRGGRELPRAAAVEHQIAHRVAGHEDRVEDPGDRRQRRACGNHRRVHADLDAAVGRLGDREELDPVAELARVADVLLRHPRDALGVDVLEVDEGAERERDEDLELVRRVHALDVEGRVGFGVPRRLRLLEDHGEVQALVGHLRQDVVRRPVDDAEDREDTIGDEPLFDGLDQRDAARDGRLEGERRRAAPRLVVELGAVVGEERLVGGDHVLGGGERLQDERARGLEPADELDDDLDGGIREDARRVRGHRELREVEPLARSGEIGVRDRGEGEPAAGAFLEHRAA